MTMAFRSHKDWVRYPAQDNRETLHVLFSALKALQGYRGRCKEFVTWEMHRCVGAQEKLGTMDEAEHIRGTEALLRGWIWGMVEGKWGLSMGCFL
jgi:hypothetical protein